MNPYYVFSVIPVKDSHKKQIGLGKLKTVLNKMGIAVDDIHLLSRASNVYQIVEELAKLRGYLNWKRTLFSYDDVRSMSPEELALHVIFHYISTYGVEKLKEHGIDEIPYLFEETYWPTDRPAPKDVKDLIVEYWNKPFPKKMLRQFTVLKEKDAAKELATRMASMRRPWPIDVIPVEVVDLLLDMNIAFMENAVKLFDVKMPRRLTPEMAFRYIKYKLFGESTLIYTKSVKMADDDSFSLWRDLVNRVIAIIPPNRELAEFYRRKRKLVNKILGVTHFDYHSSKTAEFLLKLKRSNAAGIETKFARHEIDGETITTIAPELFKKKPSEFASYLKKMDAVRLIQLYNYVNMRRNYIKDIDQQMYVMPHGIWVGDYFKRDIPDEMVNVISDEVIRRFSMRKLVVTRNVNTDIKIPVSVRVTGDIIPYEPGTSFPINSERFRFGVYWENHNGYRIDIDLTALLYRSINSEPDIIGWNGYYKMNDAIFSGDVTDGKDGAAEFIDVDVKSWDAIIVGAVWYNPVDNMKVPVTVGTMNGNEMVVAAEFRPDKLITLFNTMIGDSGLMFLVYYRGRVYATSYRFSTRKLSSLERFGKGIIARTVLGDYKLSFDDVFDIEYRDDAEIKSDEQLLRAWIESKLV